MFPQTAGFVLFRKYKSQFTKMLHIILNDFLNALREREDSELNPIILEIQSYIEDNKFLSLKEGACRVNCYLVSWYPSQNQVEVTTID